MRRAALASFRGESLADRAYLVIREQILRGKIPLGSPLSRRRLAENLEMSSYPSEKLCGASSARAASSRPDIAPAPAPACPPRRRFEINTSFVKRSRVRRRASSPNGLRAVTRTAPYSEQVDVMFNRSYQEQADSQFLFSVHNQHFQFHMRIAEIGQLQGLTQ